MLGIIVELIMILFTSPNLEGGTKLTLKEQGDNFTFEGRERNRRRS